MKFLLKKVSYKKYKIFRFMQQRRQRRHKFIRFFYRLQNFEYALIKQQIPVNKNIILGQASQVNISQVNFFQLLKSPLTYYTRATTLVKENNKSDSKHNLISLKRKLFISFCQSKNGRGIRNLIYSWCKNYSYGHLAGKLGFSFK